MKDNTVMVTWTPEKLKQLHRLYIKAKADNVDTFTFEDNEFVVGYAKYLIEYLESKFGDVE